MLQKLAPRSAAIPQSCHELVRSMASFAAGMDRAVQSGIATTSAHALRNIAQRSELVSMLCVQRAEELEAEARKRREVARSMVVAA